MIRGGCSLVRWGAGARPGWGWRLGCAFLGLTPVLLAACDEDPTVYGTDPEWAEHFPEQATAQSYATGYNPTDTLAGPPDVDAAACTDNTGQAWRPQFAEDPVNDGVVQLDLQYSQSYVVQKVFIYEGANPGAVSRIHLVDSSDSGHIEVIAVSDTVSTCPGTLEIEVPESQQVSTSRIQLFVDTTVHTGAFEEIDTVGLWDYEVRQ